MERTGMDMADDDVLDEWVGDYKTPPPTKQQILKRRLIKALPYLPYAVLAVGAQRRSTHWLVTAVFTMLAVNPSKRFISINDCHFTSDIAGGPGLVIQ